MPDLADQLSDVLLGSLDEPSPPVEVRLAGGRTLTVCFRRLSDRRKQILRARAMAWVEQTRRAVEEEAGAEIRDAQASWEEIREARWELLIVHAAMRRPDDPDQEAMSLRDFELAATSDLIHYLSTKYKEFEEGLDVDAVTPERIQEAIEEIKKNDLSLVELWQQYGFAMLAGCLLTLAAQPETSETKRSSPGSFTDP